MFTGIVEQTSRVVSVERKRGRATLAIARPAGWKKSAKGSSVSVDGVCLTLSKIAGRLLQFDLMGTTVKRTTLGELKQGDCVNLERPLRMGDELGGHVVSGHVDGVGYVARVVNKRDSMVVAIRVPRGLMKYCAPRGSVAVNGVSLTIVQSRGGMITASLIPTTLCRTNLGILKRGGSVNVEVDLIARYVAK